MTGYLVHSPCWSGAVIGFRWDLYHRLAKDCAERTTQTEASKVGHAKEKRRRQAAELLRRRTVAKGMTA